MMNNHIAQQVERIPFKDEVSGSNPDNPSPSRQRLRNSQVQRSQVKVLKSERCKEQSLVKSATNSDVRRNTKRWASLSAQFQEGGCCLKALVNFRESPNYSRQPVSKGDRTGESVGRMTPLAAVSFNSQPIYQSYF